MDRDLKGEIEALNKAIEEDDVRFKASCAEYAKALKEEDKINTALLERTLPRKRLHGENLRSLSRREADTKALAQAKQRQAAIRSSKKDVEKNHRSNLSGAWRKDPLEIPTDPKEGTVLELLERIPIRHVVQAEVDYPYTPCCCPKKPLPPLPPELRKLKPLAWGPSEEPSLLRRWLNKKLCLPDTVAIPVHDCQPWMKADFPEKVARMDPVGIDFLIAINVPDVAKLAAREEPATPDELRAILKYVIGAYQLSPESRVSAFGVLGLWPKAVMQAIALNSMAYENGARWMIPVFAGDLNRNLALHKDMHEATLHAAVQSDKQDVQMSLRFMRWLLKNNRSVAEHCWGPLSTEINKEAAAVPQEDAQDDTNQAPGDTASGAGPSLPAATLPVKPQRRRRREATIQDDTNQALGGEASSKRQCLEGTHHDAAIQEDTNQDNNNQEDNIKDDTNQGLNNQGILNLVMGRPPRYSP
ncbi:g7224 [Coccomyxa viridis]|uniref:G7224 protein n=1 Tax=Coccomyxa viridis TaxID=1274662 RepID=A0ABP1FZS1_9CHLO